MVGEPRYASLKGIMGARSKEIATVGLDELGLHGATLGGNAEDVRTGGPAWVVVGTTPDGRDLAGMLAAELRSRQG
jgi:electron transfer flavoprotein alpha/beta subunit